MQPMIIRRTGTSHSCYFVMHAFDGRVSAMSATRTCQLAICHAFAAVSAAVLPPV